MTQEKLNQILLHVKKYFPETVGYQRDLINIVEGGLLPYVKEQMKKELSAKAYERAVGRIPPINIFLKLVEKLSALYTHGVARYTENAIDQDLVAYYEKELELNSRMASGNKMFNTNKYFALEPYSITDEMGKIEIKLRILPANKFIVYSDDSIDPTNPTAFIKISNYVNGLNMTAEESFEKSIFFIYTDTEFIPVNGKGELQPQYLNENGGINPFGMIPYVYGSSSEIDLIPMKDEDSFLMSKLPAIILADLNYSVQYQCHSVLYGIDLNVGDLEMNPDSFWLLNSQEGDNKKPAIGTIKPDADIDKVVALIKEELSMWYESKGLKVNTSGNLNNSISGVAKLIDEADATEARAKQINIFTAIEKNFWKLLSQMHNYYVSAGMLEETRKFSDEFEINIEFASMKPIVDDKQKLEEIKLRLEMGLTSKFRALKEANPTLTDGEIKQLMDEIEKEKQADIDKFMSQNNDNIDQDMDNADGESKES
jgi:hypothetical protein